MNRDYAEREPARAELDALRGPALVEFGSAWCGHCRDGREVASLVRPRTAEAMRGALARIDAPA